MPGAWDERRVILQMAGEVWRHGRVDGQPNESDGRREPSPEAHVCGPEHAERSVEGSPWKKVDRPSQRREMAETAVERRGVSIVLACRSFGVSETCYRYSPKLKAENEVIADLLTGLTDARKTWGFGLCFLHLRNVKGHPWNHKRVYRIYCELELNLRIKPRKRLKREKPDVLAVPVAPNVTWSMDFMADRLGDGCAFRLLNVLDDFNREGLGDRGGLLVARRAGHSQPEPHHGVARQARHHSGRQWPRIHQREAQNMG